jgi:hypothetical protein
VVVIQRQRVLAALRRAGPGGITQVSFLGPFTADGGPPITRLAARVGELRDEGYEIVQTGLRDKCAVYVLKGAVAAPVRVAEPAPEKPVGLFDPATASRPLGAYDDYDADAA